MSRNYVIINLKANGAFNCEDDKQLIFIEAMQVDENLNVLDSFNVYLEHDKEEKSVILEFIKFCNACHVITYDAKYKLAFLLKALYKNKINNNFKFNYIDIKDMLQKELYNIEGKDELLIILKMLQIYLRNNNIANLNDLFASGLFHKKIFRGLYYPKYLIDIEMGGDKYAGYVVDGSTDRYISYYVFLKELNGEYLSLEEVNKLRALGAKVIMSAAYFDDKTIEFTDCYFVLADQTKVTSACAKLITGISNLVKYSEEKNVKLLLWGSIKDLRDNYDIIDKSILEKLISLICLVKKPWDYWSNEDVGYLE